MTTVDTDRSERGRRAFAEVMTFSPPDDSTPATEHGLIDFVFGEVWTRPGLSRRDRRFITLPCVAAADAEEPLREHVYAALNSGDLTIAEMRETVLHFAVYSGWPKASRFNIVVDESPKEFCCAKFVEMPLFNAMDPVPLAFMPEAGLNRVCKLNTA